MCLIPWERTQKRDPHKLFRGIFGVKKSVRGGEPEGVRKHLLSKQVFSVLRRFLEGKKASKKPPEAF